ncbi:ATPase [Clostridium sp.]|uniref:ParM/StbA family protein n=1 Tax=Clostridium sp. TaxID=1506 RepID=UPI0039909BA3
MIIGIDLGNYGVSTSEGDYFLAKYSEVPNFGEKNKVIYNGDPLYLGDGEFSTDWNKSKKETTLPLLFSALAREGSDTYYDVVLGLPAQQYKNNKESFKTYIEDNKIRNISWKGIEKEIIITNVLVAPEGAAAYYCLSEERKAKIGSKQLIIVDIGGRTTDIILFQNNSIVTVKTIAVGMLNVYTDIIDTINTEFTADFKLEEAEDIVRNGLFYDGESKDTSFITPILKKHFNSIFKDLQFNFNINKGYVLLTGGGSLTFQKAFENRLNNVLISPNPLFDNAIGFKKLGESIWQEK